MCEPSAEPAVCDYFDEQTWERLDPELVRVGEEEEMKRFQEMGTRTLIETRCIRTHLVFSSKFNGSASTKVQQNTRRYAVVWWLRNSAMESGKTDSLQELCQLELLCWSFREWHETAHRNDL